MGFFYEILYDSNIFSNPTNTKCQVLKTIKVISDGEIFIGAWSPDYCISISIGNRS